MDVSRINMPSRRFDMELRKIILNPFKMHLADAILATHLARHAKSRPEVQSMHCRTAIAHTMFALECAANCFVGLVPRNHHFRDKAEMWPVLDKLDLYLLSRPNSPKIPRDDPKVKAVRKLIEHRDRHVHPRNLEMAIEKPTNLEAAMKIKWPGVHSSGVAPASFIWSHKDASTAINTILDFLRLFMHLGSITSSQMRATLSTTIVCTDGNRLADVANFDQLLKLAPFIDVDLDFLIKKQEG